MRYANFWLCCCQTLRRRTAAAAAAAIEAPSWQSSTPRPCGHGSSLFLHHRHLPRRQPQPHELSGSASSPFMGPPRPPIGPHHSPHTWHPLPRFLIRSHPSPILGLFVPPRRLFAGLVPESPHSRGTQMYLFGTYSPGFGREKRHPTVLSLAPFNGPSSPSHWRAPYISYVASTSVTTHWLVPFLSQSRCPRCSSSPLLQAWFPNNLVPRDSNVPLLYM